MFKQFFLLNALTLLFFAGCSIGTSTTNTGNTNATVNTANNTIIAPTTNNVNASNANATIDNENINDNVSDVDTSDWLTYTNKEYGFSLRYPQSWFLDHSQEKTIYLTNFHLNDHEGNLKNGEGKIDIAINQPTSKNDDGSFVCVKDEFISDAISNCDTVDINNQSFFRQITTSQSLPYFAESIENDSVRFSAYFDTTIQFETNKKILETIFSTIQFE